MFTLKKRVAVLCMAIGILFMLMAGSVCAAGINTSADCKITLTYPCEGAPFRIYRVADIDKNAVLCLTDTFGHGKYPISLVHKEQSGWRATAEALAGYIARDGIEPLATGSILDGVCVFEPLQVGLYLVLGDPHTDGEGVTYTPIPFFIRLPDLTSDRLYVYEVTATPKYEKDTPGESPKRVTRRVHKVWKDEGASIRPTSVTVDLLCDGAVYDTVILSADTGWSHTWEGLDSDHTWQVAERNVPEAYTVTVSREGITFLIVNTYTPPVTTDTEPPPTDTLPPEETTPPDTTPPLTDTVPPEETTPPGESTTPPDDEPGLPPTGLLWWPIPLLAACGLFLFCAGFLLMRDSRSEH